MLFDTGVVYRFNRAPVATDILGETTDLVNDKLPGLLKSVEFLR